MSDFDLRNNDKITLFIYLIALIPITPKGPVKQGAAAKGRFSRTDS